MYQLVNKSDFHDAFKQANRATHFSPEALDLLYDFLAEIEAGAGYEGPGVELDVIALCAEYSENTGADLVSMYTELAQREPTTNEDVEAFLQENTLYIGKTSTGFVYADF